VTRADQELVAELKKIQQALLKDGGADSLPEANAIQAVIDQAQARTMENLVPGLAVDKTVAPAKASALVPRKRADRSATVHKGVWGVVGEELVGKDLDPTQDTAGGMVKSCGWNSESIKRRVP
jgi:hypothetical protein